MSNRFFSVILCLQHGSLHRFYLYLSQSMQMSLSLFVQKFFPHFMQTVFLSKPLSSDVTGLNVVILCGKLIAFLWHSGSHAVQPLTHLCGWATMAFPSRISRTLFGQNSTQRGFSNEAQPSHFSGKIVGYHTPQG